MCEVAILNPDRVSTDGMYNAAKQIYESQRSALGMVAVYDQEGEFHYDIFREVEPRESDILDFVWLNEDAYRVIIHGRLATSGERDNEGTHPLPIDCPECNVDHVLHNGIVSMDYQYRRQHRDSGHEYTTNVDSEVIAHEFGTVPEEFELPRLVHDHHPGIQGQPCYILLNSERMYIHTRQGFASYNVTGEVEMWKPKRWFENESYDGQMLTDLIVSPSSEPTEPDVEDADQNAGAEVVV